MIGRRSNLAASGAAACAAAELVSALFKIGDLTAGTVAPASFRTIHLGSSVVEAVR
jgi:hypothetical protein